MLRLRHLTLVGLIAVSGAQTTAPSHEFSTVVKAPYLRRMFRVPLAGTTGLEGMMVTPSTPGKHPLVVMLMGPHLPEDWPGNHQSVKKLLPEAYWFASRGYAVAVASPRGWGQSDGKWFSIGFAKCTEDNVEQMLAYSGEEWLALYASVRDLPEVDATRVLSVGEFVGGTAGLWVAAHAPQVSGLKAVIAFGLSPYTPVSKCKDGFVVPAYGALGSQVKIPSLWIGRTDDERFPRKELTQAHDRFVAAGGNATLSMFEPAKYGAVRLFGTDAEKTMPAVEAFLRSRNLPADVVEPMPKLPEMHLPAGYDQLAEDAFQDYLRAGPSKAFALGQGGHWGWSSGAVDVKSASDRALDLCRQMSCRVVATGD